MKRTEMKNKRLYEVCAHCGKRVLKSTGMMSGGRFYCEDSDVKFFLKGDEHLGSVNSSMDVADSRKAG
jgi:hypothetical protein